MAHAPRHSDFARSTCVAPSRRLLWESRSSTPEIRGRRSLVGDPKLFFFGRLQSATRLLSACPAWYVAMAQEWEGERRGFWRRPGGRLRP